MLLCLQESLICDVMEDVGLDAKQESLTKAFIAKYDENAASLGGYKYSKGFMIGIPQLMNFSSIQVSI